MGLFDTTLKATIQGLRHEVKELSRRIDKVEDFDRTIDDHSVRLSRLEESFKTLNSKVDTLSSTQQDGFKQVNDNLKDLTCNFNRVIEETRAHVDNNVANALNRMEVTMSSTTSEIKNAVGGLTDRVSDLEQKPYVDAYKQKEALVNKIGDIIFKIVIALLAAGLAAKGFKLI
jgi:methyl-accepting chemotaxis protein